MQWMHKDVLDTNQFTSEEIFYILETAKSFQEINTRAIKKVPTLKGKSVVLFFAEPSTRTKTSFDMAGKRLSADTFSLSKSSSSLTKGETLKDTVLTLQAMNPDAIVLRHNCSGAAQFIAKQVSCSVINAGDGCHAHPTQALLDAFTLNEYWKGEFAGKKVLILGDIAHSRVARSNIQLLQKLGVEIHICAPRTLLPRDSTWENIRVFSELDEAVKGVDAIMCLRLQLERQSDGLLPHLQEYAFRYCLQEKHLELAGKDIKILHPGPINRGLEISSSLADSKDSVILEQVSAGLAIRMALLYLCITGQNTQE